MLSDIAHRAETISATPAVAYPSSATNDSTMVLNETISPETRDFDTPAEASPDRVSHFLAMNDSNMVLDSTIAPENQDLTVSTEISLDMASLPLEAKDSNMRLDEGISPEAQQGGVLIESSPDIGSPFLATIDSNMVLNEVVSIETRQLAVSIEASQDMALPSSTADGPTLVSESFEMSSIEWQEQPPLTEAALDIDTPYEATGNIEMLSGPNETNYTGMGDDLLLTGDTPDIPPHFLAANISTMVSELFGLRSPEIPELPVFIEDIPVSDSPPVATVGSNVVSESSGLSSTEIQEVLVSAEAITGIASPLLPTVGSNTVSEEIKTCSLGIQEPSIQVEVSSEMDTLSSTAGGSETISEPTEAISSEIRAVVVASVDIPSPLPMGFEHTDPDMSLAPAQTSVDMPEPQFKRNFANETIQLRIGPKDKCVLVHKYILNKSPFFASLFRQYPIHEQPSQFYHFPAFDVYAFATIVHWLYHGNIQTIAEEYKADGVFHTAHMVKVYCLCYKLQLRSLMNLAIELLGHGYMKNHSAPTIEDIDAAYSYTGQWSGLRIYMATWARCRRQAKPRMYIGAPTWDSKQFAALNTKHPELLRDLEKLCEGTDPAYSMKPDPRYHLICWYHDHLKDEICGVAKHTFETVCNGMGSCLHEPI